MRKWCGGKPWCFFGNYLLQLFERCCPCLIWKDPCWNFYHWYTKWPNVWSNIIVCRVSLWINTFGLRKNTNYIILIETYQKTSSLFCISDFYYTNTSNLPPYMAYNQRPQFSQQSPRGSLRYQNHTFSHFLLDLLGCWTVLRHGESQIILYANSQVHLSPETINGLLAAQNCRNLIKRKFKIDSKVFC